MGTNQNQGFSLVEMLVTAGVAMALAVGIANIAVNNRVAIQSVQSVGEFTGASTLLTQALADPASCTSNMTSPSAPTLTAPFTRDTIWANAPANTIPLVKVGQTFGQLYVKSIDLYPTDTGATVPVTIAGALVNAKKYLVQMKVTLEVRQMASGDSSSSGGSTGGTSGTTTTTDGTSSDTGTSTDAPSSQSLPSTPSTLDGGADSDQSPTPSGGLESPWDWLPSAMAAAGTTSTSSSTGTTGSSSDSTTSSSAGANTKSVPYIGAPVVVRTFSFYAYANPANNQMISCSLQMGPAEYCAMMGGVYNPEPAVGMPSCDVSLFNLGFSNAVARPASYMWNNAAVEDESFIITANITCFKAGTNPLDPYRSNLMGVWTLYDYDQDDLSDTAFVAGPPPNIPGANPPQATSAHVGNKRLNGTYATSVGTCGGPDFRSKGNYNFELMGYHNTGWADPANPTTKAQKLYWYMRGRCENGYVMVGSSNPATNPAAPDVGDGYALCPTEGTGINTQAKLTDQKNKCVSSFNGPASKAKARKFLIPFGRGSC